MSKDDDYCGWCEALNIFQVTIKYRNLELELWDLLTVLCEETKNTLAKILTEADWCISIFVKKIISSSPMNVYIIWVKVYQLPLLN